MSETLEKMSPQVALDNLDRAASVYGGSRQDHVTLTQSVMVLRDFLIDQLKKVSDKEKG